MEITIENIAICIINSAIFVIAVFSAYATKFQEEKRIFYPYGWFIMGLFPLIFNIYKMASKHSYTMKEIIYCVIILIEAVLAFIFIRKLLAPAIEDIENQEQNRQEKTKQRMETDRPLIEKMKYARAMERKAQYGLHLAKSSKKLKREADEANMSVTEYREWCKKQIEQYEIMVRDFNLTHSDRWQY